MLKAKKRFTDIPVDLRLIIHPASKLDGSRKHSGVNANQTKMLYLAAKISFNEMQHVKVLHKNYIMLNRVDDINT